MSVRVFVPRDAAALSVGAGKVAEAVLRAADRRGVEITLVRNGSRGLFWLEPLVEVETPEGRVAFGPVTPPMSISCSTPPSGHGPSTRSAAA